MSDAVSRYRAASEINDVDALGATLAPTVELISPISGRMVFRGEADLRILLAAVYGTIRHLRWQDEIGGGAVRVVMGEARISGIKLTDAMVLELTDDGQIQRIRPHIRPWLALTLLALRLLPTMARHPRLIRRALHSGGPTPSVQSAE